MSVLVIGATGFIGPRLIRRLVARGENGGRHGSESRRGDVRRRADRRAGRPRRRHAVRGRDARRARRQARAAHQPRLRPRGRRGQPAPGHAAGHPRHGQLLRGRAPGRRQAGGLRELDRGERPAEQLRRPAGHRGRSRRTARASTRCTRSSTSSRPRSTSRTTACRSPACAPPTSPGPTRSAARSTTCRSWSTPRAAGRCTCRHKGLMRLLIHVEDMAEVFARVLLADAPRHSLYNSGGIPVEPRRAGGHRARVPPGRADHVRQGGRPRGVRQLPGRLEPPGQGVRDRVSRACTRGSSRSSTRSGRQEGLPLVGR